MSDKYEQARRKLDELYHYKAIYPAQVGYRDRVVKEYLRSQFPEPAKIEGEEATEERVRLAKIEVLKEVRDYIIPNIDPYARIDEMISELKDGKDERTETHA